MCSEFAVFTVILIALLDSATCARILGIIPTPSISHQLVFRPIWRELSLRGHDVVVLTTDPMNDRSLTNLTEIDLHVAYEVYNVKHNMSHKVNTLADKPFEALNAIIATSMDVCRAELQHPQVQMLIANESEHFDVALIEILQPPMFAFQHRFNCPLIGVVSMDAPPVAYELFGSPAHPAINPDFMLPLTGTLSFFERLFSVLYAILAKYYGRYHIAPLSNIVIQEQFIGYPPVKELMGKLDMLFVNVHPVIQGVRPLVPAIINIGPGIHLREPRPLPKDLQKYLDNATDGVIYLSLGTNVKSTDIPEKTRKVIIETFAELPYDILWKFEADDLEGKSNNVRIMKWVPQQDVLRHPNVKLFITQAGLQSTEEAIFSHVPMVAMPFFGDQIGNAKRMALKGVGLHIDHLTLTKEIFKNSILEVMTNPRYKENAKELAELVQDEPMTGLEKAVWWTEYVIRHKGAKHLRSPAIDLPIYQYFLLDVIGFILVAITVVLYVTTKIIKFLVRLIISLFISKKVKTN